MPAETLAAHIRALDAGELRTVVHYDGDDYDGLFKSDRVAQEFTDIEYDEVAKHLVLKALDDGFEQPEFSRFGHLDATVRWFHDVVAVQVPLDDWSGVIVTFDRDSIKDTSALVEEILAFVDEEFHTASETDEDADDVAEEFAAEFEDSQ
jgi:hypothetical protein